MRTDRRRLGRGWQALLRSALAVLVVCSLTDLGCSQSDGSRPVYNVSPQRLALLTPGTVIGKGPPQGWSHLVIKSHPRPGAGDLDRVNERTARLASFIFTAFVANVKEERTPAGPRYRLNNVALGLGSKVGGNDTILSPDTQKRLGADLGILQRTVFTKAFEMQNEARLVARSDTMAVIDTSAVVLRETKHRPAVLRYVLLVDSQTGRLDTLLFGIDRDSQGGYAKAFGVIEWLPASKIEDAILHVDGNEFSLGIPSEIAFAALRLPKGQKQIDIPEELKEVAGKARLSAEAAALMETKLREALYKAAAAK